MRRFLFTRKRSIRRNYSSSQGKGRPFRFWKGRSILFKFLAKNAVVASLKSDPAKYSLIALKVYPEEIKNQV